MAHLPAIHKSRESEVGLKPEPAPQNVACSRQNGITVLIESLLTDLAAAFVASGCQLDCNYKAK